MTAVREVTMFVEGSEARLEAPSSLVQSVGIELSPQA
jgi:hypothetical protein